MFWRIWGTKKKKETKVNFTRNKERFFKRNVNTILKSFGMKRLKVYEKFIRNKKRVTNDNIDVCFGRRGSDA